MIPNAFAAVGNERTITVQNAPGSSVPGCEKFDGCFIPNRPSIRPGDTVVWTNPDTTAHTATSGSAADGPDGVFDSSLMMAGQTFSYQFTKSGLYNYYCMVHPWREGIIIVKEGPDWTPPSNPTSKTPSKLILDPLPNIKAKGSVTFSGQLVTAPSLAQPSASIIPDATITLKFTGFTVNGLDHYTTTTNSFGKFNEIFTMPNVTTKKDYAIQAFYNGSLKFESSQSQIEHFTVIPTTSSQPSTSSLGGPTFLKLEIETDKRDVTVSGKLTDPAGKFTVRNVEIIFIPSGFAFNENAVAGKYGTSSCKVSGFPNCELTTDNFGDFYVEFRLGPSSISKKYSIQAVFGGNNQWESSKSLTQSFTIGTTVGTPPSQPQTSTSSGDLGWIWILIILGVVFAGVAGVLAKKGLKKTPKATPQRRTFGVKQPKKRRTGSPASVPPSRESASTFAHYECPNCHSENVVQNPNGSEYCSDCGWKS